MKNKNLLYPVTFLSTLITTHVVAAGCYPTDGMLKSAEECPYAVCDFHGKNHNLSSENLSFSAIEEIVIKTNLKDSFLVYLYDLINQNNLEKLQESKRIKEWIHWYTVNGSNVVLEYAISQSKPAIIEFLIGALETSGSGEDKTPSRDSSFMQKNGASPELCTTHKIVEVF